MILSWILLLVLAASVLHLFIDNVNARIAVEVQRFLLHPSLRAAPLGCLAPASGLLGVGLWTGYAIDVGEWRFAAIAWMPLVCGFAGGYLRAHAQRRSATDREVGES